MAPTDTDIDLLELNVIETRAALIKLADWLSHFTERKHLQESESFRLEIALTEVLTNIADHAYTRQTGDQPATIFVLCTDDIIKAKVTDSGRPFNPLAAAPPVQPSTIEVASEGGLGIGLVNHFVDDWFYERLEDQNQLTLLFNRQADLNAKQA